MPAKAYADEDAALWNGTAKRRARAIVRAKLPAPCCRCGREIEAGDQWDADHHPVPRINLPSSEWLNPDYLWPCHSSENRRAGQRISTVRKRARRLGVAPPAPAVEETRRPDVEQGPGWAMLRDGALEATGMLDLTQGAAPRYFTPSHPLAGGTHGPKVIALMEAQRRAMGVPGLRPWQAAVVMRLYEYLDDEGQTPAWPAALVTVPRGCGKSWLLRDIAMIGCLHPQEIWGVPSARWTHVSRRLMNAVDIQSSTWAHFEGHPRAKVRKRSGSEAVLFDNGSVWEASTLSAMYGKHGSSLIVDEAHGIDAVEFARAAIPTTVATPSAQVVMFSTRHPLETPLLEQYRGLAAEPPGGEPGTALFEWSASPGADPLAIDTYRGCAPHWDKHRERAMRLVLTSGETTDTLMTQWANVIPVGSGPASLPTLFEEGQWLALRRPGLVPSGTLVAAVEDRFGGEMAVALAWSPEEGRAEVLCRTFPGLNPALAWLDSHSPHVVLAGKSLTDTPWAIQRWAQPRAAADTAGTLAELRRMVADGPSRFTWSGDDAMARQWSVTVRDDPDRAGLAPGKGPVGSQPIRAAAWAVAEALRSAAPLIAVMY